ncbi:hypothetical protein SCHPADRAFT_946404 [Schizopora paradoxa]|uniref:Uncharacterized protein n=1 Tax=Schizopora paradoxa TaxID=27342 RepID=A0A0H2R415_9AGAM|nr:hypothetical protein SCHPADRAFT_946404 [Schizopora paradoxa]
MPISGDAVWWLLHGATHGIPTFSSVGHFPIRASGNFYVAAVKVKHIYYFTTVKEGDCRVTYTDENGDVHYSVIFYVLINRHVCPIPALVWREFWPRRDPLYRPESDSAKLDDEHLESCLNILQEFEHHRRLAE